MASDSNPNFSNLYVFKMRGFLGKITKRDFLGKTGNKDSFPRVRIFIVSSPFMTTIKELAFGLKIVSHAWEYLLSHHLL